MAIYTKTGDKGETSVLSKESTLRVTKDSLQIEAIGTIDELNSYLGVIISSNDNKKSNKILTEVQKNLFTIGAILAGANLDFSRKHVKILEKEIDLIEGEIPPLSHFILPQGTALSSNFHFARSIARRAERRVVTFSKKNNLSSYILMYLNRLSDFLFICSRKDNFDNNIPDNIWIGKSRR